MGVKRPKFDADGAILEYVYENANDIVAPESIKYCCIQTFYKKKFFKQKTVLFLTKDVLIQTIIMYESRMNLEDPQNL